MRVEVNMGRNKLYAGIVAELHERAPEQYHVKPIRSIIDDHPIINPTQLRLWQWVSSYYIATLGDVMQAALPAHLKLMSESLLVWTDMYDQVPDGLSDDAFIIAEALLIRKQLTISEVHQLLQSSKHSVKAINEVLETGAAVVSEILEERYKVKKEKYIFLQQEYEDEAALKSLFDELEKKPKQLSILMTFLHLRKALKGIAQADLCKRSNATSEQIKSMVSKGIFYVEEIATDRILDIANTQIRDLHLSDAQQQAYDKVLNSWDKHTTTLLQGVTGSGKTMLYIRLIKEQIDQGKQVLFLLPEIALTTQILARLRAYFGEELGVYHSKYSNNERIEIWKKVADQRYKVVIGPRSALWLPFNELGLIIVDEEHDGSYKQQEPSPKFHARDVAIYLAKLHQSKVLLGTATPSIESAYNVQKGKYGFVALTERFRGVSMPVIETVNAKNTQAALSPILTLDLLSGMQDAIKEGKQVILFQNKRGYAPFLMCGSCGFVPQCKYCDVSLTYHKATDKLHCHYCGTKTAPIKHCPQCGNAQISARTFGTEKIEEDLQRIFPHFKVARMDWDSMRTKNRQLQLIEDFSAGKIDILVGTQMVVKGLDFENVALVGILSADSLLSYPDFRVYERAFQLMEQVSGRAGRMDGNGKVLIQTHKPTHPIIQYIKQHDFKQFYLFEIGNRQQFTYPPFVRLIKMIIKHKEPLKAAQGATLFAQGLKEALPDIYIQGPAEAIVPRVRNMYIQELLIKLPLDMAFIQQVKAHIASLIQTVPQNRGFSALQIFADVDPN
ncbi:Primosomal protein N' [compost metagenome]